MDQPVPPPEAVLLRLAREAAGISSPAAASAAGISKARLSQIETGYETRAGQVRPVRGKDSIIARLAAQYGIGPDRLEAAGRPRAAEVLREIGRRGLAALPDTRPAVVRDNWADETVRNIWGTPDMAEQARLGIIDHYLSERHASPCAGDQGDGESAAPA